MHTSEHSSTMAPRPLPAAEPGKGLRVLAGLARTRNPLTALALMREYVGQAFEIPAPRFRPAVFIGPDANRQILITDRNRLSWRNESDPVVKLLRRGVLIVDGEEHDRYRQIMDPTLQRRHVTPHIPAFWRYTDQVAADWADGSTQDMLIEMRKVALLILMGASFHVDFTPHMAQLWQPILDLLEYISPGLWIVWPEAPTRTKHRRAIAAMDDYLYAIIRQRRAELAASGVAPDPSDLLGALIVAPRMTDDLIRDQLLTMLIAGHDTSTALLAWVLYLLGMHPATLAQVQQEVDRVIGSEEAPPTADQLNELHLLDQVIKETLRLYPPIHIGNRRTTEDMAICGYHVPAGKRVMYSIYLSHRDKEYWRDPDQFCPARFERGNEEKTPPFTYVPFGGGPRTCIGATFAQVEARAVLARLLQRFDFELLNGDKIHPHMGATLEPRPGVQMRVRRRSASSQR
ncbi:MAG TPA: cytochrome P450 [Chloroflexi bacterium]|nr:cytochrome P450 [Chloroflexota bacterium]